MSSAKQENREREEWGGGEGERQVREKMKDRSMNTFFLCQVREKMKDRSMNTFFYVLF